ncbi:hypothetical protein SBA4_3450001 [Candidatus Sulfopaludibacter sp. SbA4]|nr:hypothetical protein SBA4_3450001 [Candidatus Sulfopaludibacter sp. SbA4]
MVLDAVHQAKDTHVFSDTSDPRSRSRVTSTESHSGFGGGGTLVFRTRESRYVVPTGYTSNWITLGGK